MQGGEAVASAKREAMSEQRTRNVATPEGGRPQKIKILVLGLIFVVFIFCSCLKKLLMYLVNALIKTYLRLRRPRQKAMLHRPRDIQRAWFNYLLKRGRETVWGKIWAYGDIKTPLDFRKRVGLQTYEDLYPYIHRMMLGERDVLWPGWTKMFAKSSGTTNDQSKYIPVSQENLRQCHLKGGHDALGFWYEERPNSSLFYGSKGMIMGGSLMPFVEQPKTLVGDVSALMVANLPRIAAPFLCPSKEVALMPNWEEKLAALVRGCMGQNISNLSGVPTWTVLLFEALLEASGKEHMLEVFPNFEVYNHGGVHFGPYRAHFERFFPGDKVQYREVYNASEGFFALQAYGADEAMLLLTDNGVYYEFLPLSELGAVQPIVLGLEEVELACPYALVVSTNSGLWRYVLGDVVEFMTLAPPRIRLVGRTKQQINVFGEEVSVDNAERALAEVCRLGGLRVRDYTVGPRFLGTGGRGGHEWWIEFEGGEPRDLKGFALALDLVLQRLNSDYAAKRAGALDCLELRIVPRGTFLRWLKGKGKLGGQNKVPRLANDRRYLEELGALLV